MISLFGHALFPHVGALTGGPLRVAEAGPEGVASSWVLMQAGLLTLGFALWVTIVWRARSRVLLRLNGLAVQAARGIASRRLRQVSARRMFQLARIGTRLASVALILGGAFVWVTLLLDVVPATHGLAREVEHAFFVKLEGLGLSALGVLPDLAMVGLILFFARVIHEMLNHYFGSIAEGEVVSTLFDPVTAETTRKLTEIAVWIVALIIAFPYLPGSHSAAFRGVSVLAGIMLSLGSANFVSQFTNGLTLIYGRTIRPGDYIETSHGEGVVEHIGLFACSLRTPRDELLFLPHSAVAASLKNLSRGTDGVRFAVVVTIGYDAPWRQVRELLLGAAADTPGVLKTPAPTVRQAALEDFYVRYELLFTPDNPRDRVPLLGRLHEAVQDRFHAAGVQIMSPHYRSDPDKPKIPPVEKPEAFGGRGSV